MDMRLDFTLSLETKIVFDRIVKLETNELVTYEELERITGKEIRQLRGALGTARRRARREHRMVFGTVRKEGLRRLDDDGIVDRSLSTLSRLGKVVREGAKDMRCVEYGSLTDAGKAGYNARMSVLGAVGMMTSAPSLKRVEAGSVKAQRALDLSETLRLFGGVKP